MDLNALFKAPAGAPSPLREVYEVVAKYIRVACSLYQKTARSQTDVHSFAAAACALAGERRDARAGLAAAEIGLTANAPDAFAAFHAALEGVEPINHACAHVLAAHRMNTEDHRGGDFRPCAAYPNHPRFRGDIQTFFADWPEVNDRQLLEGMRQATVLAAARLNGRGQVPVAAGAGGADGPPRIHKSSLATVAELAAECGITTDAMDSALRRFAKTHYDCREEVENPKRNEPRFVYRRRVVQPLLDRYQNRRTDDGQQKTTRG
jgi:hypothetical protein